MSFFAIGKTFGNHFREKMRHRCLNEGAAVAMRKAVVGVCNGTGYFTMQFLTSHVGAVASVEV